MRYCNKLSLDGKEIELLYETESNEGKSFSITLTKNVNGTTVDKSKAVLRQLTMEGIDSLAKLMCDGIVTPTSFEDIIIDKMYDLVTFDCCD